MVRTIAAEYQIEIQLQFYAETERDKAKYFAWLKDPIYHHITAEANTSLECLTRLAEKVDAIETYRKNLNTNKK